MRVLAVSSQVAYGPVGNTASVPALQAAGHEVLAVPTIMLSNHPGHGKPAGFRTAPEDLQAIFAALGKLGVLAGCGGILTGYFASAPQVSETADLIGALAAGDRPPFVLVDPVLGDGAALYVAEEVAATIRDYLVPLATCLTPNRFELEWLSGLPVTSEAEAIAAARRLAKPEVLATSIPADDGGLVTLLVTPGAVQRHHARKLERVPHGTGDFLSGLYLAARLASTPEDAFESAMAMLDHAIAISAGTPVLNIAGALRRP